MKQEKPVYPSDVADKVLLRLPNGMREELKEAAKANNRTMNAEIIARLGASFERTDQQPYAGLIEAVNKLSSLVDNIGPKLSKK